MFRLGSFDALNKRLKFQFIGLAMLVYFIYFVRLLGEFGAITFLLVVWKFVVYGWESLRFIWDHMMH